MEIMDIMELRFPESRRIHDAIIKFIYQAREAKPVSRLSVQTAGWNSLKLDIEQWNLDELKEISAFVVSSDLLEQNFKSIKAWFNIVPPGGIVKVHDHVMNGKNEDVAIVYMVQGQGDIVFPEVSQQFKCESGRILLFPCSLKHEVEEVQGSIDRISVAMNVCF